MMCWWGGWAHTRETILHVGEAPYIKIWAASESGGTVKIEDAGWGVLENQYTSPSMWMMVVMFLMRTKCSNTAAD